MDNGNLGGALTFCFCHNNFTIEEYCLNTFIFYYFSGGEGDKGGYVARVKIYLRTKALKLDAEMILFNVRGDKFPIH
jgi:hypothetical protein